MSKNIIFVGTKSSGNFALEEALSKGWNISFVETSPNYIKKQIADISIEADKGCDAIIYDTREYLEDAEVIAEVIASIKRANGAKPILVVPTANKENSLICACLDKDIKHFINAGTGTATDWKRELVLNIAGHYDAQENEPEFTKRAREYISNKKIDSKRHKTIGIAGSIHRIGTTTVAIQIIRYLEFLGYKACLVEMNENKYLNKTMVLEKKELSFIEKTRFLLETEIDNPEDGYIRTHGIDMYYKSDKFLELEEHNYDYYVFDYGVYTDINFNKTAFLKDDLQFFCVGANAIEMDYTWDIAENLSYKKADLIFSFTALGDRDEIRYLMEGLSASERCYFTEYTPNPYILSNVDLYKEMIPIKENEKNTTNNQNKKKKSFFKRSKNGKI